MFDWVMRLASSSATFLFPVFASYKALKTNDPQQVTPWLMYWVVIACIFLVEAWTEWLLRWLPFYYNIRAAFMLWLVLPQTQGATKLYLEFVHPFLDQHERDIENFISDVHEQLKAAGYAYLRQAIAHAEEMIFGTRRFYDRPPTPNNEHYTSFLLSRFKLSPIAQQSNTGPANDFYNSISSTISHALPTLASLGQAQTTKPKIEEDRTAYILNQQVRLRMAMAALDKEMAAMKTPSEGIFKSPSGASLSDFDHVDAAEVEGANNLQNWMNQPVERPTAMA